VGFGSWYGGGAGGICLHSSTVVPIIMNFQYTRLFFDKSTRGKRIPHLDFIEPVALKAKCLKYKVFLATCLVYIAVGKMEHQASAIPLHTLLLYLKCIYRT
jgi:hypothetical protein